MHGSDAALAARGEVNGDGMVNGEDMVNGEGMVNGDDEPHDGKKKKKRRKRSVRQWIRKKELHVLCACGYSYRLTPHI